MRLAAHVHSAWSYDGHWTLDALARAFARRGYDAVLMAEHDRTFDPDRWAAYTEACAAAGGHGALLVPGIEYSDPDDRVHVPVWGAAAFLGRARPTATLLAAARDAGGVAVIAHPARRDAWSTLDERTLALASGVEIWNRKYDGVAPGAAATQLVQRYGLPAFVGLDFHTARQFCPLAMVAPEATRSVVSVIAELRAQAVWPTAFRLQVERFTNGGGRAAAVASERTRRSVARQVRRVCRAGSPARTRSRRI